MELLRDILDEIKEIHRTLHRFFTAWETANATVASGFTMTIQGETTMSTFTIDTTDGVVNFQWVDSTGAANAGPLDSVTGVPVPLSATSSDTTVLTLATSAPGADAGSWTEAITLVAEGSSTVSPVQPVNSDGTVINGADGNPLPLPAAIVVTVTAPPPPAAAGFTMTITG